MTDERPDSSSTLRSMHELELAALVEGFEEARRANPTGVTVELWCEQYPRFAEDLAELLPGLLLMESVATETSEAASRRAHLEPIPESIGEYRIKAQIGRGGMGIVYLAEQASLGREVALKVLPTNIDLDRGFLERFKREAQAAAKLLHPNIVPVFGAGQADGRHFFAMRYIEGASLDEILRERLREAQGSAASAFPLQEAVRLVLQVASAVSHAHAKGILHRDIKPGNVLLDSEGRAWVTDFGLCRMEDAGQLTSDGAILGTLRYMSPEQIEGVADERSDVYGVGLLLFELLIMRPAFDSVKRAKVVHDVLHTPVPRLRRLRKDIPRSLETIVQKATTKLPQERYQSAEALQRDLEAFLEDRPISARPPSALYLARLFASRHRLATAVAVVASLLLGLLGALYVRDIRASQALSEQRAYVGDLAAAEAALREGATQRARYHLDQAPASLRSWEWAHLDARIDQSLGAVKLSSANLHALSVDPTGERVAVASVDGVSLVRLPDLEAFAEIRCGRVRCLSWDTTGKHLFAGLDDGRLHHYGPGVDDPAAEFELLGSVKIPQNRRREPKSIVPIGDDVIVGARYGNVLRWTPESGALVLVDVLSGHIVSAGVVDSPNGGVTEGSADLEPLYWVASGSGEIAIYRGTQRVEMLRIDNRQGEVTALQLNADLKSGIATTRVGSVLGFENAGEDVVELYRGSEALWGLGVDGRFVVAVGTDKLVHLIDRESGRELRALSGSPHPLEGVAFVPGTPMILTAGEDGWLRAFDRRVSGGGIQLHGHIDDVNSLCFSPDGRRLVTGGRDGVVMVWDVQKGIALEVFTEPVNPVSAVGFSTHDGAETIFAGTTGGQVYCWTAPGAAGGEASPSDSAPSTGPRTLRKWTWPSSIHDAEVDPGSGRIFFATSKGVECLDPASLDRVSRDAGSAMFGSEHYFVVVTSFDGRMYCMTFAGELFVFDPATGELHLQRDTGFRTYGARLSMTNGGPGGSGKGRPRGVFVSTERDVVMFDGLTGETEVLFSSRTVDGSLGELVMESTWIEGGERLLVTTRNGLVSVWDPENAKHLLDLRGHPHWAMRIEQCEATGWIASLSAYGGVRLWNTVTTKEWAELAGEGSDLVDQQAARLAAASVEQRGIMERVADKVAADTPWKSSSDWMLVRSLDRANAANVEVAAMNALGRAGFDRSSETVALLESAAMRLSPGHSFKPLVDRALLDLWDVVAWRDGQRGTPLRVSTGQVAIPPTARKTSMGVGAVCLPLFVVGPLGGFAPVAKEILWLLRL